MLQWGSLLMASADFSGDHERMIVLRLKENALTFERYNVTALNRCMRGVEERERGRRGGGERAGARRGGYF